VTNSASTLSSSNTRLIEDDESNSIRATFPMLTTALTSSGVEIELDESNERPLLAVSPFTTTVGDSPLIDLPVTVSSAAVLPGTASATIEEAVITAKSTQADNALRNQSLWTI
jgi:hypothetical protein